MSLPYFNLYPRDFEADTSHLSLEEDGAYNRLLRLCWMTPGASIPDDDAWIMRRMRVDQATFDRVVRVVLEEFFQRKAGRVSNARLSKEFAVSTAAHDRRVSAGKSGGTAKALKNKDNGSSNAKAMLKQPEPEADTTSVVAARDASPAVSQDQTARERLLSAMGADPTSGMIGPNGTRLGTMNDMAEAQKWADLGVSLDDQCRLVSERMTQQRSKNGAFIPRSFGYFSGAMSDFAARKSSPLPKSSQAKPDDKAAKVARWNNIAKGAA